MSLETRRVLFASRQCGARLLADGKRKPIPTLTCIRSWSQGTGPRYAIEKNQEAAVQAKEAVQKAGFQDVVTVIEGDAMKLGYIAPGIHVPHNMV